MNALLREPRALALLVGLALTLQGAATAQSTKVSGATIAAGDVRSFRWSADGDWLLYVADADQDQVDELYSVALAGSNLVTKLNPPLVAGGDVASASGRLEISDDSAWALYLADQAVDERRELYRVPLDGSATAQKLSHALSGNATLEDFLTDGPWIAYRAFRPGLTIADLFSARVDASQGPVTLTGGETVTRYHFSPDGARVALEVHHRLYTVDIGGGPVHGVSPSGTTPGTFDFTPNGHCLVWNTETAFLGGEQRLWSARADGSGIPSILIDNFLADLGVFRFEIASTGRRLVYISDNAVNGRFDLHSAVGRPLWPRGTLGPNPSIYGLVKFQDVVLAQGVGDGLAGGVNFHIGPDGTRVAYLDGVGVDPELFSIPIRGFGGAVQLTNDVAVVHALRFSPDSQRIVYLAELESDPGTTRLFSVPADGSASSVELSGPFVAGSEIDTTGLAEPFEISADSSRVVYRADQTSDDVFELYARALDGSGSAVKISGAMTTGGDVGGALGTAVSPAFRIAPDSASVVYAADQDQDERFELYATPLP